MKVSVTGHYSHSGSTVAQVELSEDEQREILTKFNGGAIDEAAAVGYYICSQMGTYRSACAAMEKARELEVSIKR